MKTRSLAILAGVTAVAIGAAMVLTRTPAPSGSGEPGTGGLLLSDFATKAGTVAAIDIKSATQEVKLEKKGEVWVLPEKGGFPADNARVRDLLKQLASASIAEVKTSKPDLYSRLGVEDVTATGAKSTLVTLKDGSGKDVAAVLVGTKQWGAGEASPLDESAGAATFVRRAGEAQAYRVKGEIRAETEARTWLQTLVADIAPERVREVRVTRPGESDVVVARTKADEAIKVVNAPEGRAMKEEFAGGRIGSALASVTLEDVAAATAPLTDAVVETRCFDGLKVVARGQKDGEAWWFTFEPSYEAPPAPPPGAKPEAAKPGNDKPAEAGQPADAGKPVDAAKPAAEPAPAANGPSDAVKQEIERLEKRWKGWKFKVPSYKADAIAPSMESLLRPVEAPATPPAAPSPGAG